MLSIKTSTVGQEQSGVWVTFNGSELLIASTNNPRFQREFSRLQHPYRRKIEKGTLDPEIMLDLIASAASRFLLLGWEKVFGDNDKTYVDYDHKLAKQVLAGNSELREFVLDFAQDITNYLEEETEEVGES